MKCFMKASVPQQVLPFGFEYLPHGKRGDETCHANVLKTRIIGVPGLIRI